MPKVNIRYCQDRVKSPLSFWVHKPLDADVWENAILHEPAMPAAIIGKGFPLYEIVYRRHTLIFASIDEIKHCIEILSNKILPTTYSLASQAGYPAYQHLHWLSQWPGEIKSWKDRQAIIKLLEQLIV